MSLPMETLKKSNGSLYNTDDHLYVVDSYHSYPIISGKRVCNSCKEIKGVDEFYSCKRIKCGIRPECKKCYAKKESKRYWEMGKRERDSWETKQKRLGKEWVENERKKRREWYRNNPEKTRQMNIKAKFGIDSFVFKALLLNQENKCSICGNLFDFDSKKGSRTYPHIDHNHETGEIRGVLCGNCNIGIGNFKEDEGFLLNAIFYLKNYPQKNKNSIYVRSKKYKEKRVS